MNRLFIVVIALTLIVVVVSAVILFGPSLRGGELHISDPKGDVLLNVGSTCPGMIDIVGANLTRSNDLANVTVKVGEPFASLGPGEAASWELLVVLENETDVLKTYIISVEADSGGFSGSFYEVTAYDVETFDVDPNGQWVNLLIPLSELQSASMIEWHVESIYEAYSGDTVIADAYDVAPDQGLQTTELEP